ncbi:sag-related sequence srs28, partial [Cystoisospora suis]
MAVFSRLFVAVAFTTQASFFFASAAPSVNSTCAPGTDGFQFVIGKVSQQAVFKCGDNAKLKPETSSDVTQVCTKEDCSTNVVLTQLVPTATIKKGNDDYTFSLTKLPETEQIFYLQCISNTVVGVGGRRLQDTPSPCLIKFTVKTKPAGIPECASKDTNVDLKVDAAGKHVQFLCGDSFPTLDPKTVTEVYKDSSCSQSVALTSIASGATLSTSSETDVHTLAVPNLPSSQQQ